MKIKLLVTLLLFTMVSVANAQTYLFIGSYTNGKPAKGIYVYSFDTLTGHVKRVSHAHKVTNPSYITFAPDGRHLYACTESLTSGAGSVSAFAFDSSNGRLAFINKQHSNGENPVYDVVDKSGRWLVNANYSEGSVAVHLINADGSLQPAAQVITFTDSSIDKERQSRSHIHSAVFAPAQNQIFLPDLGADKIRVFSFHPTDTLPLLPAATPEVKVAHGSGPRHFAFHPNGKYAYCIEEMGGNIAAFSYANDQLTPIQTITSYETPHNVYGGADIHISPDGRFLYTSNRVSENSIGIFSIDTASGKLTLVGHQSTLGEHPRNFTIDPTGNFLLVANQFSNNIVVFKRNLETGLLSETGTQIKISHPSCLQIRSYGK